MSVRKLRWGEQIVTAMALVLTAWMGITVLAGRSLRHSGIESLGPRSVEAIVFGMKEHLSQGAQFICNDFFDSGLDFELRMHDIRYRPSPAGELLIVTPAGLSAERTLKLAGIDSTEVRSVRKIAHYPDADVYLGERAQGLPFRPAGDSDMGVFTSAGS